MGLSDPLLELGNTTLKKNLVRCSKQCTVSIAYFYNRDCTSSHYSKLVWDLPLSEVDRCVWRWVLMKLGRPHCEQCA